MHQILIVWAG